MSYKITDISNYIKKYPLTFGFLFFIVIYVLGNLLKNYFSKKEGYATDDKLAYLYNPNELYDAEIAKRPHDGHSGLVKQYYNHQPDEYYDYVNHPIDNSSFPQDNYSDYGSYDGESGYNEQDIYSLIEHAEVPDYSDLPTKMNVKVQDDVKAPNGKKITMGTGPNKKYISPCGVMLPVRFNSYEIDGVEHMNSSAHVSSVNPISIPSSLSDSPGYMSYADVNCKIEDHIIPVGSSSSVASLLANSPSSVNMANIKPNMPIPPMTQAMTNESNMLSMLSMFSADGSSMLNPVKPSMTKYDNLIVSPNNNISTSDANTSAKGTMVTTNMPTNTVDNMTNYQTC